MAPIFPQHNFRYILIVIFLMHFVYEQENFANFSLFTEKQKKSPNYFKIVKMTMPKTPSPSTECGKILIVV